MRNTKLVAGLSVAALTALGVTAFTFGGNGNQEEKKEETANIQEIHLSAHHYCLHYMIMLKIMLS